LIILKAILIILALMLLFCAGVACYAIALMKKRPPLALYERRTRQPDFIPLSQIPKRQVDLLVKLEDSTFYSHRGYDVEDIRDALQMNLKAGHTIYGGSTITQQLAKNLYFRFTHSYIRRAVEFIITLALERQLGKDRILELYINIIYFGNGIYGISDAARFYFDRPLSDLTLNQMLILAIIPAIPTKGNPIQQPEVFERVRNKRVEFLANGKSPLISREEAAAIKAHGSDALDPKLRKNDGYNRTFSKPSP
jgi:penicillin-binding protein 2A